MKKSEVELEIGDMKLEGGVMNLTTPLMLDDGRKIAFACDNYIIVIDSKTSKHVAQLELHQYKVVSLVHHGEEVLSCDEQGFLCKWKLEAGSNEVVQTQMGQFPLDKNSQVEHIAYSCGRTIALVVKEEGGPRMLKLLRDGTRANAADGTKNKPVDGKGKIVVLAADLMQGSNIYSFNSKLSYCAVLTVESKAKYALNIVPVFTNKEIHRKNKRVLMGDRCPVCVAVHPTQLTTAVGDTFGGVQIYYEGNQEKQVTRRLHWHHAPVLCLAFSPTGKELYSGGFEGVLVCWSMGGASMQEKAFLPYLGQPVSHVAVSGGSVLASHTDNTFSVIDVPTMSRTNLLLGHMGRTGEDKESLLLYDPRTQSLLTNARAGHLHFYDPWGKQQLFHLDVAHENYIPEASSMRDVRLVSLSEDGLVLATLDAVPGTEGEAMLKFWAFSDKTQSWVLECTVLEPHPSEDDIALVSLQPKGDCCLSLTKWGAKLWQRGLTKDNRVTWQASFQYDSQNVDEKDVHACWDNQGDLLAISEDSSICLYLVEDGRMEFLNSVNTYKPIKNMMFLSSCNIAVVHADGSLTLQSFQESSTFREGAPLGAVALHQLGPRLAVVCEGGKVLLVDEDLNAMACLEFPATPLSLTSSPFPNTDREYPRMHRVFAIVPGKGLMSIDVSLLGSIPDEDLQNNNSADEELPEIRKDAIVESDQDLEYVVYNDMKIRANKTNRWFDGRDPMTCDLDEDFVNFYNFNFKIK